MPDDDDQLGEEDETTSQSEEQSGDDDSGDEDTGGSSGGEDSGDESSGDDDSGDEEPSASSDDDSGDDESSDDDESGDEEPSASSDDDDSGDDDSGDDDSGDDESDDGDSGGKTIRDVMSGDPVTIEPSASVEEAAQKMKESDIGAVLVVDDGELKGIVTDREIAVDAVAEGNGDAKVEDVATTDPATVGPDDEIDKAIELMRDQKVRRIPVVEDGEPVGVVSLGDLAEAVDDDSVLSEISSAEPNA
jgi:CBS domain-containing protein